MSEGRKVGPFEAIAKVFKQIVKDEKNTPEGKTNTFIMGFALFAAVATSVFSGSSMELEGGDAGWSAVVSLGDAQGAFVALVAGGLTCVAIVGGLNEWRRRADRRRDV